jgi:REP-associated tyrosine transposase
MPYWRLYYHIVWATKGRMPTIAPDIEDKVHHRIGARAVMEGGRVYALNGMEDHIHLVVAIPPSRMLSKFIQIVKGSSAHLVNTELDIPFSWQDGYGVFSVGPQSLDTAIEYVKNQKIHHQRGSTIEWLEYFSEHSEGPRRPALSFNQVP